MICPNCLLTKGGGALRVVVNTVEVTIEEERPGHMGITVEGAELKLRNRFW